MLLREALRPHLGWHSARLAFVSAFLIALFRVKTRVNLSELAVGFCGKAATDSHIKLNADAFSKALGFLSCT